MEKKSRKKEAAQEKTEVAQVEVNTTPAVQTGSILPSLTGAGPEIIARMEEVKDNLESVESFRLPRAKMTAEGLELIEGEEPIKELEGVIIHTKKSNVYYAKPYNSDEVSPPDCFSLDGNFPDKSIPKPVNPTCKGCPMAEFGTNQMKSGKACRNMKPMYLLLSDEAIMPRQLTITPSSLKSANQYLMDLTERGIAYRKVKTKVTLFKENSRDTYFKMKFSVVKKLTEQEQRNVEFLRNEWLPIMNAQMIDQREVDSASSSQVKDSNGEF
jgi:hypothetical protein